MMLSVALPLLYLSAPPGNLAARGDEIVAIVRDNFYRPEIARTWAEKYAGYGAAATGGEDFVRRTRAAIAELAASHTAYYAKDDAENVHLRSIYAPLLKKPPPAVESIGVDIAEISGEYFVRHVFVKSPAAQSGLVRGDRIVTADKKPFHPRRSFAGRAGRKVALQIERERGAALLQLDVVPRKLVPVEEWLSGQEASGRTFDRGGKKVAYHQIFNCAGPKPLATLDRALKVQFEDADALVLDIRDGWGGCAPELTNLFNRQLPVLGFVDREGKTRRWASAWMKPVVLLINENSRSGKELVAFAFKKHRLGRIVGRRTAGAFLAGRIFPLSDGSLLYLALEDVDVDGVRLEGTGVAPDVELDAPLPYANGADPQLERAIEEALRPT